MRRKAIIYIAIFLVISAVYPAVLFAATPFKGVFNVAFIGGDKVGTATQSETQTTLTLKVPNAIAEGNLSTLANETVFVTSAFRDIAVNLLLNSTTGLPTSFEGKAMCDANVNLAMVNTAGFIFGKDAQIQAANIIISTLKIDNDNFLNPVNGEYKFYKSGDSSFIYNAGRIAARPGGYVVLLSQAINNSGTIQVSSIPASVGNIVLAVGERMTVSLDDKSQIQVAVDEKLRDALQVIGPDGKPIDSAIKNSGKILADGGRIVLTSKVLNRIFDYAINNTGIINATSMVNNNGVVELIAEGPSPVLNAGTIEAGIIKVRVIGSDLINRGSLCAKIISGSQIGGDIGIKASNLIAELGKDKKISADRFIAIDCATSAKSGHGGLVFSL